MEADREPDLVDKIDGLMLSQGCQIGAPGNRQSVAHRLAREGATIANLNEVIEYLKQQNPHGSIAGLFWTVLSEPKRWESYIRDLHDYATATGKRPKSGGAAMCVHGRLATEHCGSCDPTRVEDDPEGFAERASEAKRRRRERLRKERGEKAEGQLERNQQLRNRLDSDEFDVF